ncbi:hypothetical protein SD70_06620 [Gordoniibacillus kamchatkensis]|uniref:Lipoprotein n=1 Tax=Gordoniibacillus kamchatkensis TaxID=1590651 RepID=A0ABR5AM31_9BACL|nr:hypothetical protein SD70_06620 [Paenibacillus sp. VKM B-2647]
MLALLTVLAAGCMYPNELRKQNTANPAEFIPVVQGAVDRFHAKTGVLPIKNSEEDTPIYEKYMIDFKKLQEHGLISTPPVNSFESGGLFLYVLVHPETKPEVKLLELSTYQSAGDVQNWVNDYKKKNGGQLPKGEQIAPYFYYVDFGKLGKKPPQVKSVYNRNSFINYIVHESGQVAIDYAPDLMLYIKAKGGEGALKPDEDLRELLVQDSLFVPGKSFPYRWENGQPIPYLPGT